MKYKNLNQPKINILIEKLFRLAIWLKMMERATFLVKDADFGIHNNVLHTKSGSLSTRGGGADFVVLLRRKTSVCFLINYVYIC